MNLWMDTAQTRWTARHKQHIGQEACFFGNRLPASFYTPRSLLSRSVWPIKQTLRIRTPPEKKAPCKSANAEVKTNHTWRKPPWASEIIRCPGRLFAFHQKGDTHYGKRDQKSLHRHRNADRQRNGPAGAALPPRLSGQARGTLPYYRGDSRTGAPGSATLKASAAMRSHSCSSSAIKLFRRQ